MPIVMTFGDSNTHGTPPIVNRAQYQRYDAKTRWPTRMAALLGEGWELVEEGLPGRTTAYDDPLSGAHMNAQTAFRTALLSHGPLDVITLMLGTNDTKLRMMADPSRILGGIAGLADTAFGPEMSARHPNLKILLIAPPPVQERGVLAKDFWGARDRSLALAPLYRDYAQARGMSFLDAGEVLEVSPIDGVHFAPEGHAALAQAVAKAIAEMTA